MVSPVSGRHRFTYYVVILSFRNDYVNILIIRLRLTIWSVSSDFIIFLDLQTINALERVKINEYRF